MLLVFFNRVPYTQISGMTLGMNIMGKKVSIASFNGARGFGGSASSASFRGWSTLRKFSGSNEHLHWFKIDFNVPEIITVQNYNKKI